MSLLKTGTLNKSSLIVAMLPILKDLGYVLWDCECRPASGMLDIKIFFEKMSYETGGHAPITLSDCVRLGRLIRPLLEVEFNLRGAYHLEISSPGTTRRLRTLLQRLRYVGQRIQVTLCESKDQESQKYLDGILMCSDETSLSLKAFDKTEKIIHINLEKIKKINAAS